MCVFVYMYAHVSISLSVCVPVCVQIQLPGNKDEFLRGTFKSNLSEYPGHREKLYFKRAVPLNYMFWITLFFLVSFLFVCLEEKHFCPSS